MHATESPIPASFSHQRGSGQGIQVPASTQPPIAPSQQAHVGLRRAYRRRFPACHANGPVLYTKCLRFARALGRSWSSPLDDDDLVSAAGLGLTRATKYYQPQLGALDTYAFYYVRSCVLVAHKRQVRWLSFAVNAQEAVARTEEERGASWDGEAGRRHATALCTEAHIALKQALPTLPEKLQDVLRLRYLSGCTVTEIAQHFGRSRAHIHRDLSLSLALMRHTLES